MSAHTEWLAWGASDNYFGCRIIKTWLQFNCIAIAFKIVLVSCCSRNIHLITNSLKTGSFKPQ